MTLFAYITWSVDRLALSLGFFNVYWYSLLFVVAFLFGQYFLIRIFKQEGRKGQDAESLILYTIIGTIIGARLGHCLFYQPGFYLSNPLEILYVWKGGLASHGAAIGILISTYLYVKKKEKTDKLWRRTKKNYLWVMDRGVIVVASGGALVRLGNLMNSEIIGKVTNVPWAFIFTAVDQQPRHPTQIYESLSYLLIFFILLIIYNKRKAKTPRGRVFGPFLILLFSARFFLEFFKENQVNFETNLTLNMGQLLSIPLVLLGIIILSKSIYLDKKVD